MDADFDDFFGRRPEYEDVERRAANGHLGIPADPTRKTATSGFGEIFSLYGIGRYRFAFDRTGSP